MVLVSCFQSHRPDRSTDDYYAVALRGDRVEVQRQTNVATYDVAAFWHAARAYTSGVHCLSEHTRCYHGRTRKPLQRLAKRYKLVQVGGGILFIARELRVSP